jgi:alkylation response protein AidB-like acyl-CoA dehydrogenase
MTALDRTTLEAFNAQRAAQAALPTLRRVSAAGEAARRVAPEAIAAMAEAGLARLLTPKVYGGYELPVSAQVHACMATGSACSAASWVNMVCAAHTYVVARFPHQCRDEVFGGSPDVLIPGALAPQGQVARVDGGWRLNGRWHYGSGIDHGPWVLLGCLGEKTADGKRSSPMHVVVPRSDIAIEDTWFTLGMRGTGSKDLIATDVFVPAHRAMETAPMFNGDFTGEAESLYRLPVMGGLASMLAGTVVGFSEAGLAVFVDATRVRREAYAGASKAQKVGVQLRVAEASGEIAAARSLIEQNCMLLDEGLKRGVFPLPLEQRVQIRWNAAYAVELCRRAIERVFAVSGAHAMYDGHPLQRVHRDISTASHHAIVDFDNAAEIKGRFDLGLEQQSSLI